MFLRENGLPAAPFEDHLIFRRVEFHNYSHGIEFKFILRGGFERERGLPGRLRVKRRTFSGDRKFPGSSPARIYSDVFVQNFRADGD